MDRPPASRLRSERGQTSAEYIGLILVVVAIIAAVAASGIGATVTRGIGDAICSVTSKDCDRGGSVADSDGGSGPDADADGISDKREETLGTHPNESDTDGDGILDGQEADDGTNPLNADTDGDGVKDVDDPVPGERDADGDGLSDAEELALGANPRRSDSDGDGVADRDEYERGTDPTQRVAALTDENRSKPWERVGMSEDEWREFEGEVLDEVNPDGLEGFLLGKPYIGVTLDESGKIAFIELQENGLGGIARVLAGAGRGLSAAQAGARAASKLPSALAGRLGRLGVLPSTAPRFAPGKWLPHFEQHGAEFGYKNSVEYLQGARGLVGRKNVETFTRANGDRLYYDAARNEFAAVRPGGVLKTYFRPERGGAYWKGQTGG